ncbi:Hint domain-containing protein [Primorskyibacter sp. S87]|uniref:Hint domain-containing protein n=1 Tax=Primorskyibacter sp. S87 TaxID=3415126 RepID=UPI003C7C348F
MSSGKCAPIVFRAGAIGPHQLVALSPNHRVLVTSTRAEVLFGEPEVLVKAKDLVNDHSIRQDMRGGLVTYVHLLFDDHEIICGGGMLSESYHPGLSSFGAFDRETQDKALRLMPDLQQKCASGYGPTTRPVLRSFEANALLSNSLDPGGGEPRRISG